ncbi:D-3-phosphoglycerate dehydrogenase 3, chloroplastic [Ancistrocladus abbreviatus]
MSLYPPDINNRNQIAYYCAYPSNAQRYPELVGSKVARHAKGLGMHVIAHDPYAPVDRACAIGVELVSFEDAISNCRFHLATSKMLNDETFAKMMKESGSSMLPMLRVIDEEALVRAPNSDIVALVVSFANIQANDKRNGNYFSVSL